MSISKAFVSVSVLLLFGCSVTPSLPPIEDFADSMGAIVSRSSSLPAAKTLEQRVLNARREDFAKNGVVYGLSDRSACGLAEPPLVLAGASFGDACQLETLSLIGDDLVPAASAYDTDAAQSAAIAAGGVVIGAENQTLLKEFRAKQLETQLLDYAEALKALAASDLPSEVGTAAVSAINSVGQLNDTVQTLFNDEASPAPRRDSIPSLVGTVTTEVSEAARYSLLKRIVVDSDPTIQRSSLQLGLLAFDLERGNLEPLGVSLQSAVNARGNGTVAGLKAIEDAYDRAASAADNATFRTFVDIGTAHAAIRASLTAPRDLEALAKASERIAALAEAVRAVDSSD